MWFITCHGSAIVRALHAAMQQEQVGGENGANEEEEQDDDDGMDQDRLAKRKGNEARKRLMHVFSPFPLC